jgi:hypothetical protein
MTRLHRYTWNFRSMANRNVELRLTGPDGYEPAQELWRPLVTACDLVRSSLDGVSLTLRADRSPGAHHERLRASRALLGLHSSTVHTPAVSYLDATVITEVMRVPMSAEAYLEHVRATTFDEYVMGTLAGQLVASDRVCAALSELTVLFGSWCERPPAGSPPANVVRLLRSHIADAQSAREKYEKHIERLHTMRRLRG